MENPFKTAKVGDYVNFGNYPQTVDGQEQPIDWQVLAIENNKILVISKYGLEAKRFDRRSNNWKKSEICQWANNDFYNRAFTEQEKKYIQPFNGDKVFFLSKEEAEKYFANDEARQSKATEYSKANGAWLGDNGCSYWWLRSPDPNSINCLYGIGNLGNLYDYYGVYGAKTVARPALWINI